MFIDIVGLFAAGLTTFCQVPQALQITKTRHTKDISLPTYTALGLGVLLWVIYGVFIHDPIVIIANIITFILVAYIWVLKLRYG